ncbi:MAG TPA: hypothetical protein VL306_01905 [Methylomirabilota bacterium]|jgi:hypothetical protein|nr:hypothetical protein [Methylomirabilota bacterium]
MNGPKTKFFTTIKIIILILALGSLGFYYSYYGFTFPPCEYREEFVQLPENLKNTEFVFSTPVSYGESQNYCSETYQQIKNQVLNPIESKPTIPAGTKFTIEKVFWLRNFGISGIDRDQPKVFIIKDENHNEALVWCAFLSEYFIEKNESNKKLLNCWQ